VQDTGRSYRLTRLRKSHQTLTRSLHEKTRSGETLRESQGARRVDDDFSQSHGRSQTRRHRAQSRRTSTDFDQRRSQSPVRRPKRRAAFEYFFSLCSEHRRSRRFHARQPASRRLFYRETLRRRQVDQVRLRLRTGDSPSTAADEHHRALKAKGKSKKVKVKEAGSPRDIKERTFNFALEIVRLCRSLDSRPGSL